MMTRELFLRIMNAVESHDDYFVQKRNVANVLGLSCFQKVTAAFRMLTYGVPADATDEYVRIGESTAIESLRRFVAAVVDLFEYEYLNILMRLTQHAYWHSVRKKVFLVC
jgi:hypothetical protein